MNSRWVVGASLHTCIYVLYQYSWWGNWSTQLKVKSTLGKHNSQTEFISYILAYSSLNTAWSLFLLGLGVHKFKQNRQA